MTPWLDGWSVLTTEWQITAAVLLCAAGSQTLIDTFLRFVFEGRLAPSERFTLSLTGWTLPPLLLALLWYVTRAGALFWMLSLSPLIPILFRFRFRPDPQPAASPIRLFLLLFLFLSLPLRLAYAAGTDLPLYFDSAQHYLLIKIILQDGNPSALWNWLSVSYYHLGFHFLAAFIAHAAAAEIARVMLILGQVILLLLPFSVFYLVRRQTNSDAAGGVALLLAAWGWYMPAHAVNWGKYPALMSLGLIPFTLSLLFLIRQSANQFSVLKRWLAYAALTASLILTLLTHSRSAIVLGIVLLAWATAARLEKYSPRAMKLALFITVVIILLESVFLLQQPAFSFLFDPYLFKSTAVTAVVLLLAFFAWQAYRREMFAAVLTIAAMVGCQFLPVTVLPSHPALSLLDRPYVEMALWLPLSFLGGLGLAGMKQALSKRWAWNAAVLLAGAGIMVNALFTQRLYPSECCILAGKDDLAAITWLGGHLPANARIGIASTPLWLTSPQVRVGESGADAGVWITPLTGRTTILLSNLSDFEQETTLKQICELGIGYLFVGERGQPFNSAALLSRPAWYAPLLSMPKTTIYEVTGCK